MKSVIPWTTRLIVAALAVALCGAPELAQAMGQQPAQSTPAEQNQTSAPQQPPAQPPTAEQNNSGTAMPNPAQPPLKPVESLPQAPSATRDQNAPPGPNTQTPSATQNPQQAPVGVGAAQAGVTSGGAASRPAGAAIAPAKQHQTRSLLIKLGAIGGGAIAIGTIVGLTRATGSKPPGAR